MDKRTDRHTKVYFHRMIWALVLFYPFNFMKLLDLFFFSTTPKRMQQESATRQHARNFVSDYDRQQSVPKSPEFPGLSIKLDLLWEENWQMSRWREMCAIVMISKYPNVSAVISNFFPKFPGKGQKKFPGFRGSKISNSPEICRPGKNRS